MLSNKINAIYLLHSYLYTVAETCKQFSDLAAIQYRRNYPNKYAGVTMIGEKVVLFPNDYDVKVFGRKFLNLCIRGDGLNHPLENELLEYILLNCSPNLQSIRFEHVMLNADQLNSLKQMLHRVETVVLHKCGMTGDFHETLLSKCPRLKQLIVSKSYPVGDKWMNMKYPLLESVQFASIVITPFQRELWLLFFRKNPQIKKFSFDQWYSMNPADRPIEVIVKNTQNLTHLYISMNGIGELNDSFGDLRSLAKLKQFECLELQFNGEKGKEYLWRHQQLLANMHFLHAIHLNGMMLTKESCQPPIDTFNVIASLTHLKRLHFNGTIFDVDFAEMVSKRLPNLEDIHCDLSSNNFNAFIHHSPKLRKIRLMNAAIGELNLGWGLSWLNNERLKLSQPSPITIFVKSISTDNAEHSIISSGIIAIVPITQDKRILLNVKNTFVVE